MPTLDEISMPPAVRRQVDRLVARTRAIAGEGLCGVYLHGSLAMGGFRLGHSDVDLLAVTRAPMPVDTRRELAAMLLDVSGDPCPIEISFMTWSDLHPWRHPAPFDLHYSETWRDQYRDELAGGAWQRWGDGPRPTDDDLAAHVTVTRARGVVLWGAPIEEVFPPVPQEDYLDAVRSDIEWAQEGASADPSYLVLNLCRTLAYLADGQVRSKEEGAEWALANLPGELHSVVAAARAHYRGLQVGVATTAASVDLLLEQFRARLRATLNGP